MSPEQGSIHIHPDHQSTMNSVSYICSIKFCFIIILFKGNALLKIFYSFNLREQKGGRNRGRETLMCGCLLCVLYWGPGLKLRHVSQTGIRTGDSLIRRLALNPLSHTSQGIFILFSIQLSFSQLNRTTDCSFWSII